MSYFTVPINYEKKIKDKNFNSQTISKTLKQKLQDRNNKKNITV